MPVTVKKNTQVAVSSLTLFCLALFLTAYSAKNPTLARLGSGVVEEILYPFQLLHHIMHSGVTGIWDRYVNLVGLSEQNERLLGRLKSLEAENSRLLEFVSENERLRGLLGIIQQSALKGVVATVVGYDPSNWVHTVAINRGLSEGIHEGMAVLEGDGVVGQVIAVGPTTSKVLLITDHVSGVDAIVQGSRMRGIVEGAGERTCKLRFATSDEDIKIGDRVITSGMDGVYPKGLLIGVITDFQRSKNGLFQQVEVRPSVDFLKLENVLVVTTPVQSSEISKPTTVGTLR